MCNADEDDDDEAIFPEISVSEDEWWPVVVANACT